VVQESAAVLTTVSDRAAGLEGLFVAAAQARSSVSHCEQRLARALEKSTFCTVEDAVAALLDPAEEARLLQTAQNHRKKRQGAETTLETLAQQGVPEERPDLERTGRAKDDAVEQYDQHHTACTTAVNAAGYCDAALERHDELVAGSGSVRVDHERAERAYAVCNNGGALSMSLKRWVLTRELDRVTDQANSHLRNMTAHRYSLQRRGQVTDGRRSFGLDLEVLDAATGRPRSTTTLSGGEQFQASLALALGLADVVSHGGSASGKRFEALFVDEGFGSLDPQALDDAIDALHQLHSTGRMVGAITHVEAMKHQLHVGIAVTRLPDGGGSTLVVNP
jgi:exonuclease SbcC